MGIRLEQLDKTSMDSTFATDAQVTAAINTYMTNNKTKFVPYLGVTTNVGNAYSVTTEETIPVNQKFTVTFNAASTGAATLNISTLGTNISIIKPGGLSANIKAGNYDLIYNGSNFQLLGEGGDLPKVPNLLKNGGFENDLNCWGSGAISTVVAKFGTKSIYLTGSTSTAEVVTTSSNIPYIKGHKYYVSWWVLSTVANISSQVWFPFLVPYVQKSTLCSVENTWYFDSMIAANADMVSGSYAVRIDNNNANIANQMYFDGLMVIDLTDAFCNGIIGTGTEPDLTTMNALVTAFGGWWDSDLTLLTADATAVAWKILLGNTAYINGVKVPGTMNNRQVTGDDFANSTYPTLPISKGANTQYGTFGLNTPTKKLIIAPPIGFYPGGGMSYVTAEAAEVASAIGLTAADILSGKTILNIAGTATALTTEKKWASGILPDFTVAKNTALKYGGTISGLNFSPGIVILGVPITPSIRVELSISMKGTNPLLSYNSLFSCSEGSNYMTGLLSDSDFLAGGFNYYAAGFSTNPRTYSGVVWLAIA